MCAVRNPSVTGGIAEDLIVALSDPATTLTARQVELIALYASGWNYQRIAEAKFVSYWTVRNILEKARSNVGAQNLVHLCTLALESGVIVRNGHGFVPVVDPYSAE